MEIIQAIILGVIEGLTEFLPVSSTGHLIIAEEYMRFHDPAKTFAIAIQLGAALAIVWYYRRDLATKVRGLLSGSGSAQRFWLILLVAAIPAGILGLTLDSQFESYATPKTVATALIVGAGVLWLVDKKKPRHSSAQQSNLANLSTKQIIIVGLAQCLALIPGASRSGSAIVGGLIAGMNRVTATAFSFYLGIPVLGGATLYKLWTGRADLGSVSGGSLSLVIGGAVSFVVALAAVSWLLKYVSTHDFRLFVYWRILLGLLVLILLV